jgi:tripartite ATP-independent transporter DctP family solute receptor
MRKKTALALCVLLPFLMVSITGCGARDDRVLWRFGHIVQQDHPWHISAIYFADQVYELSDGRMQVQVFPASALGTEIDVLHGMVLGTAEMNASAGTLEVFAPVAALLDAPWAFRDTAHLNAVLSGPIGERIFTDLENVGFKTLYWIPRMPRNLTSNFAVNHPNDITGINMRVMPSPVLTAAWAGAGASPASMPFAEVFMALNQGVIDMQENPFDMIYTASLFEVQSHVNLTEHTVGTKLFLSSVRAFNALDEELQAVVLEAAARAQAFAYQAYLDSRTDFTQRIIDSGMIVNANVDRDSFRERMMPAMQDFFSEEVWDLFLEIQAYGQ